MPPDSQQPADPDKKSRDIESWATLKRFLPYLWPKDNPGLRMRIAVSMVLVLAAKGVTLALPFAYKRAIDAMGMTGHAGFQIGLAALHRIGRAVLVEALGRVPIGRGAIRGDCGFAGHGRQIGPPWP